MTQEAALPPLELKHHHVAMSVPDLGQSIAWYKQALGFEVEFQFAPEVGVKAAVLRRDDMRIELFETEGAAPLPADRREPHLDVKTHGNKHGAYAVADIKATHEALKARGVDIVRVIDVDVGAAIYIRDNFGNLLEFVQQPDLF